MATQILFPKIGFAMEEGVLVEWLAASGSTVSAGQPLGGVRCTCAHSSSSSLGHGL